MERILLFIFIILTFGCQKNSIDPPPPPGKATLVFPAPNAACTNGITITPATSSITFTWNASAYTDSYELTVRNLLTRATTTKEITTNQAMDTLLRNTPYSWTIKSKSATSTTVTQSDTSKFYIPGPAQGDVSPVPAALTSPVFNQRVSGSTVNLTWMGEDFDNDIAGYDVYFGTAAAPPLYQNNVTNMYLNNVPVTSGTYYWKVVTRDTEGNTSSSDVYMFVVD